MPIPDTVAPNDDYREHQAAEQAEQAAKVQVIINGCNTLLKKQIECKKCCYDCKEKCEELQLWLNLGE